MNLIRGFSFFVLLVLTTLIVGIVTLPFLGTGEKTARAIGKAWSRIILFELRVIAGIRENVEMPGNTPDGPAIVAANHQSMWETLFLYARLPYPIAIFKKELADIPVFGWWLTRTGSITVDRKNGVKAIRMMSREAERRLRDGAQIIIFPEGTRVSPGDAAPIQSGIAAIYKKGAAPVIVMGHNSGVYWRHPGPSKKAGKITARFSDPIPTGLDKKTFLQTVEAVLSDMRPDLNGRPGNTIPKNGLSAPDMPNGFNEPPTDQCLSKGISP
ncbi:MAG: lysophospholipid acyltransferase family protein [Pseudomonadota bacterium]